MKEIEIERKYLVTKDVGVELATKAKEGVKMVDYYVPNSGDHWTLRLRKEGDKCCITRKRLLETGVMEETTIPLERLEFMLLATGLDTSVAKMRFKDIEVYGHKAVLDVYEGRHEGLVVVEIEFATKKEYDSFAKYNSEDIGLTDITGVEKYAAGKLAEW